ncbi:MAG: GNAT family N-acetyltransferase [Chloroflexi bacterium]|nr:GNAT family N-acetyltransferase [Chloroflexota bacterium]
MTKPTYQIRPFHPTDQPAAQQLILDGLHEHWGTLDPTRNPDLNDIMTSYIHAGHAFFVAEEAGVLIGTGALWLEAPGVGRIVRVSIRPTHRRRGLGRAISEHLIVEAQRRGCHELLVETTDTWTAAIRLYQGCGFTPYAWVDGDVHMKRPLYAQRVTSP